MAQISNIAESIEAVDSGEQQLQIPESLPVLPLRDIVIYPFMIVPLFVSREKSIRAVDEALGENRMIFLVSQSDLDKEEPAGEDLYTTGTVAVIMRMLKLPGRAHPHPRAGARARAGRRDSRHGRVPEGASDRDDRAGGARALARSRGARAQRPRLDGAAPPTSARTSRPK